MLFNKPKKYIRWFSCYHCQCAGFFKETRRLLSFLRWNISLSKTEPCYYCSGKGFIKSTKIITKDNDYKSFLTH